MIDANQAIEDAKSLLSSESISFINETELVRYLKFFFISLLTNESKKDYFSY